MTVEQRSAAGYLLFTNYLYGKGREAGCLHLPYCRAGSCGGGTPCFFDNMDYMNQLGETFYLKASPETLHAHLKMGKGVRPLLLNKTPEEVDKFIHEQLKLREPYYEKAKHIIDINVMDNYDKINAIVRQIRDLLNI